MAARDDFSSMSSLLHQRSLSSRLANVPIDIGLWRTQTTETPNQPGDSLLTVGFGTSHGRLNDMRNLVLCSLRTEDRFGGDNDHNLTDRLQDVGGGCRH